MIYIGKGPEGWNLFQGWNLFCIILSSYGILFKYFTFWLQVKNTFFERLCSNKTMLTVNDSFPGPTILVHKGDRAYVNVHNEASYGVTIHWWWWLSLSLSLSTHTHTQYRPSNQFGERKKPYFKLCIWILFYLKCVLMHVGSN